MWAHPIPVVLKLTIEDAKAKIRSATGVSRFDVQHVGPRAPVPPGTVVAQVPAFGSRVSRMTRVRLVVASDSESPWQEPFRDNVRACLSLPGTSTGGLPQGWRLCSSGQCS